jgi:hypothetical protein
MSAQALRMRLIGAERKKVAPLPGGHRSAAGGELLRGRRSASTWTERKRKQRRWRACPGGALAYPEAQRTVFYAGGGRWSPELKKNAAGSKRGMEKTTKI